MMKSILSAAWIAGLAVAAPSAMAEVSGLEDIVKIDIREDGRFDVVCKDGSKEVVSFEDLMKENVCKGGSDDEEEDDRPSDIEIKEITINGSGCPVGSEKVGSKIIRKNGKVYGVELDYRDLEASSSGKRRVFCNAAISIGHNAAYQYGFDPITVWGYAKLGDGAKAIHSMDISFRGPDSEKMQLKKTIEGPYEGSYEAKAPGETLWAPCGKTLPVNVKATLQARGSDSYVAMKDYKLVLPLRWKKCN